MRIAATPENRVLITEVVIEPDIELVDIVAEDRISGKVIVQTGVYGRWIQAEKANCI